MSEKTFEELAAKVSQWASDRKIIQNSTAEAQLEKLEEEREETLFAIDALPVAADMFKRGHIPKESVLHQERQITDGFGDMLVCIINAAAIAGVDPVEALAHAYGEIKDRTGHLGPDGIFYKDSA